jgi:hypothetical protein
MSPIVELAIAALLGDKSAIGEQPLAHASVFVIWLMGMAYRELQISA